MSQKYTIVTHSGSFHADDVTAGSILALHGRINDSMYDTDYGKYIIRTRNPEIIAAADIVFDVGGVYDPLTDRFDHHQCDAPVRDDGTPYSSAGLVWKHFGLSIVKGILTNCCSDRYFDGVNAQSIWDEIDCTMRSLDLNDNGATVITDPTAQAILSLVKANALVYSLEDSIDRQYANTVSIVANLLYRTILHSVSKLATRTRYAALLTGDATRWVVMPHNHMPRLADIFDVRTECPNVLYEIHPTDDGYSVKCVPASSDTPMVAKKLLPIEWAGANAAQLAGLTGVEDAIFCHKGRFVAAAQSLSGARALATLAADATCG